MSSFALKIIAIISMFCDHFGDAFIGHYSFLNLIGRLAFPIFAFQISEGFIHTKNLRKYFFRLGLFALIAQIPFGLFVNKYLGSSIFSLNVFFTLFLGLLSIYLYDYMRKLVSQNGKLLYLDKILGIVIAFLLGIVAELLNTDYGLWGVIVVFAFYFFKNDKLAMIISYITLCFIKYGRILILGVFNVPTLMLGIFTCLPIILIALYNGKQGLKIKYLLYWFYPLHLLLLYFIF